jgi:hypothetical protein
VDVEHRRVIERDADGAQSPPPARGERDASVDVPLRPSTAIGGHSVKASCKPRDPPAS